MPEMISMFGFELDEEFDLFDDYHFGSFVKYMEMVIIQLYTDVEQKRFIESIDEMYVNEATIAYCRDLNCPDLHPNRNIQFCWIIQCGFEVQKANIIQSGVIPQKGMKKCSLNRVIESDSKISEDYYKHIRELKRPQVVVPDFNEPVVSIPEPTPWYGNKISRFTISTMDTSTSFHEQRLKPFAWKSDFNQPTSEPNKPEVDFNKFDFTKFDPESEYANLDKVKKKLIKKYGPSEPIEFNFTK